MTISCIDTGLFKLDGGAMFGVVPKTLWQGLNPPDGNNRCTWALRCLLIEDGNRLLLVDTGVGDKQDEKFFRHYEPHGEAGLLDSIRKAGYSETEVTDVLLTHLHFDHVGGAVRLAHGQPTLTFPNATYWSHRDHWNWALHPNPREKASFLKENILPIQDSGHLRFVDQDRFPYAGVDLLLVDGHTEKMALPVVRLPNRTLVYLADLIPSSSHVPLPYVMSYDMRPLLTMEEKSRLLETAADENWVLVFEHDPLVEAATVERTAKGVAIREKGRLAEFV